MRSGANPPAEGKVQLAAGSDVAVDAFGGHQPVGRRARERLAGEKHAGLSRAAVAVLDLRVAECLHRSAGAEAQVACGVDVGRRAELLCDVENVASTDLEMPGVVHAGVDRERRTERADLVEGLPRDRFSVVLRRHGEA